MVTFPKVSTVLFPTTACACSVAFWTAIFNASNLISVICLSERVEETELMYTLGIEAKLPNKLLVLLELSSVTLRLSETINTGL